MKPILFALLFIFSPQLVFAATYYVDYETGRNTDAGTSTAAPWKVAPGMIGCTDRCNITITPGDRVIFKGGVEWPAAALPLKIFQVNQSGGSSATTYFGVDASWHKGSSFTKPIFNGQYSAGSIVQIAYSKRIVFDGFELKGLYVQTSGIYGTGSVEMWEDTDTTIKNCFIHDWKLDPAATDDDAHGGVFFQDYSGSVPVNVSVDSCEISNAEWSTTKNNGVAVRAVQTIKNSKIHDVPTAGLHVEDIHDSIFYNIDYPVRDFDQSGNDHQPYHTNLLYLDRVAGAGTNIYTYNNLFYNIGSGTGIYLEVCFAGNAKAYVYNNVMHSSSQVGTGGNMVFEPEGGSGACGEIYAYNNTMQNGSVAMANVYANHSGTNNIDTAVLYNNHYMTAGGYLAGAYTAISHLTSDSTNLSASDSGYTASNNYAPTSATSPTVGAGKNLTSLCSTDPGLQALCYDTTLGGSRTPAPRPVTGPWDSGAYQYSSTGSAPTAPRNLTIR